MTFRENLKNLKQPPKPRPKKKRKLKSYQELLRELPDDSGKEPAQPRYNQTISLPKY